VVAMIWSFRGLPVSFVNKVEQAIQRPMILTFACLGFAILLFQRGSTLQAILERRASLFGGTQEHGRMRLSKDWQNDMEVWSGLDKSSSSVSGTYRSLPDDLTRSKFGGPDYIIHALGSRKNQFLQSVMEQKPDVFHTINPLHSSYEEWLQLRHWDLYSYLISNYRPVAASTYHVFWKQLPDSVIPAPEAKISLEQSTDSMWISPVHQGERCLYKATVVYLPKNPFSPLPFFGKIPRYFLDQKVVSTHGTASEKMSSSLPPHETTWIFPITLNSGEHVVFSPRIFMPLPNSSFEIESITIQAVTRDSSILDALTGSLETPLLQPKKSDSFQNQ